MDYNSAKNIIEKIETEINVTSITYNNKAIWPIIKNYLFFGLLKQSHNNDTANEKGENSENEFIQKNKTINHFKNLKNYISYQLKFKQSLQQINFNKGNDNSILVVDVDDALYVDEYENRKYSRYITPYLEFFKQKNEVLFLNLSESKPLINKYTEPIWINSFYFTESKKIISYYFKNLFKTKKTKNLNLITDYLNNKEYKNALNTTHLISNLKSIDVYESLWLTVLKKAKPKLVFLECYYGNKKLYGLIAASKKLNIKVVDIQHGSVLDQMYIGWQKTPKNGYDYLPDYYWCWSKNDVNIVGNSRLNSQELKPILGGNLWMQKQLTRKFNNKSNDNLQLILKNNYEKIILVTLQHSIPISQILLDAINNSSKKWLWLIRFHPNDLVDHNYRKTYITALENNKNVEFNETTKADMYWLFQQSTNHITHHSTSAVEAITFKLPTILLGRKFETIYKEYIDANFFYLAETGNDICNLINSKLTFNEDLYNNYKTEILESVAEISLKHLLN